MLGVRPPRPRDRPPRQPAKASLEERVLIEIYRRHGSDLRRFVMRLVDDRGRAEDVVQETMLRGWRNLDRIDPERGDPRAYLYTVARHLVIDQWRAEQRRPQLVAEDEHLVALSVEDQAEAVLEAHLVEQALERLSPQHREVIDELYYRGATVTEAAARIGVPPGTVKSRSYYAIRILRTVFEEMGVER